MDLPGKVLGSIQNTQLHPRVELLKKQNNCPKNYDPYIPTYYEDSIKLTKTYIKEIKNKLITTKNIYNTIVNNVTKNYLLAIKVELNK